MSKCEAARCADEEGFCIPDHSVLTWKVLAVDYANGSSHYAHDPLPRKTLETKYEVPEGYMSNETSFIQSITLDLKMVAGNQMRPDEIYGEPCEGLKEGLKVVNCSRKSKIQPWFTANLAECRKVMHRSEARWLKCTADSDRTAYRNEYLQARQSYTKKEFQYHKQIELEAELGCPRNFWRSIKRLNIRKSKKSITSWRWLMVKAILTLKWMTKRLKSGLITLVSYWEGAI